MTGPQLAISGDEVPRTLVPGTGVKIALGRLHFHGFGVARQGPWITSENFPSTHSGEYYFFEWHNRCNSGKE